jgi:hypothetical protein
VAPRGAAPGLSALRRTRPARTLRRLARAALRLRPRPTLAPLLARLRRVPRLRHLLEGGGLGSGGASRRNQQRRRPQDDGEKREAKQPAHGQGPDPEGLDDSGTVVAALIQGDRGTTPQTWTG